MRKINPKLRLRRVNMTELIADAVLKDPIFQQAKSEMLNVIEKYRSAITEIRPPQTTLRITYEESLQRLNDFRGQDLFYPYLGSGFGNGALVELADGSVKYDFISGIGTHWGHCHPQLIEASIDGSVQDLSMQGNLQQNRDSYELMDLLVKHSGFEHCILTTSGAMANENALKMIFQKRAPASRILAFERCFMGRTLSLSQITDKPQFREGLPMQLHVDYIPFYDWRDPKGSMERAVSVLKSTLARYPKSHACMCFELILGEAGSYPGKRDFFLPLLKILKEHDIVVFIDEVQTFGRTDHLFAFQHFDLAEYIDVITCGKLLHTCATLFRDRLRPKPGLISQTFTAATSSIRVAKTILKSLLQDDYLGPHGKNMQIRKQFVEHLYTLNNKYPDQIEGPFGHGLMIACTPFKGKSHRVIQFAKALFEAGVIAFTAGSNPTRLRFLLPAGGVTKTDINIAATIIEKTLRKL